MDRFLFPFRLKKIKKQVSLSGIFCTVFLILPFAGFPNLSFGADGLFRVFRVEIDNTQRENSRLEPVKDFYINGGEDDGLRELMVLDVYRKKLIRDGYEGNDFEISIFVGKVKVVRLFKNVAITRIIALTSSDDNPVLQYRTVMIGDYAFPSMNQEGKKIDNGITSLRTTIPAKDHNQYSLGSGVLLPSKILFEFDDWRLKPEAIKVISTVHDLFHQSNSKDVLIKGHTCSLGTEAYNMKLSRKRAQSVADYLRNSKGVSQDRIRIEYYGEQFPVASNDTEEGRMMNRRVDILFLSQGLASPLLQPSD